MCWILLGNIKKIFVLPIISEHPNGTGSWNSSSWKRRSHLSYMVDTMAADDLGLIPETIRSRSAQIRSCDPDRPIAFHKRQSWSAHQIEKIWNLTVYCQLNHDINHSLGNLELKLYDCDWMKTSDWWYLFMTSQCEVWWRHLWVPIRERHGQFSARTQCCSRYNTVWTCHTRQVCVCDQRHWKYTNCWHKTDHVPVNVSR